MMTSPKMKIHNHLFIWWNRKRDVNYNF